jgi:hypothetical protein
VGERARSTLARLRDRRAERRVSGRTDREAIDAFFDRELAPDEAAALFRAISRDEQAAAHVQQTQRALDALRTPVKAPDLSQSILAEVGRRRGGWLTGTTRRVVTLGRFAVAASLLLIVTGGFVADRLSPGALDMGDSQTPLASLVEESRESASRSIERVRASIAEVQTAAATPVKAASGGSDEGKAIELAKRYFAAHGQSIQADRMVFVPLGELPKMSGTLQIDITSPTGRQTSVEMVFRRCNSSREKAPEPPAPPLVSESDG